MKFEGQKTESSESRVAKDLRNLQSKLLKEMRTLDSKSDEFRAALESMQRISDELKRIEGGQPISKVTMNPFLQTQNTPNLMPETQALELRPQTENEKLHADRFAYLAKIRDLKKVNVNDPHIAELERLIHEIDSTLASNAQRDAEQKETEEMERQAGLRQSGGGNRSQGNPDISPLEARPRGEDRYIKPFEDVVKPPTRKGNELPEQNH